MGKAPLESSAPHTRMADKLVTRSSEENFKSLGLRHLGRIALPPNLDYYGYLITAYFATLGVVFAYTAFVSKLLPDSGNFVVDFIKYDEYFCYLVPLSILPTYAIIYLNWLAMRHFEQN
mmetsp:Transcript_13707/g.30223  ORF Transcript_13707/g.30223 Transcript_13707/m.30223 type:complete len:119 (-) Transcript_13707:1985-2341(-)